MWRKFAKLRTQLFDYLYTLAYEAHYTGLPVMRHHLLQWWRDPVAVAQDYQFMFGYAFLAAPVLAPNVTEQRVYLPTDPAAAAPPAWYDVGSCWLYDNATTGRFRLGAPPKLLPGGQWVTVDAPIDALPLFALAGTIVPMADPAVQTMSPSSFANITDYDDVAHVLHLWVFPDAQFTAQGQMFDGGEFTLDNFTLAVGGSLAYVFVAQVPLLPAWGEPEGVFDVETGAPLPAAASWEQLVGLDKGTEGEWRARARAPLACASDASRAGWAFDAAQRVLWVRFFGEPVSISLPAWA